MQNGVRRIMLAGLGLFLATAADASAATLQCGDTVTQDVALEADLLDCPGDGLLVTGAGVTLDLNGHRVDGTGTGAGIRVLAPDVTLRNGRITGFQDGVRVAPDDPRDARLTGLEISGNARGVVLAGDFPGQFGGGSVTVSQSAVHHNDGSGILASLWPHSASVRYSLIAANGSGIVFRDSRGASVVRSSITANRFAGIGFEFSPGGRVVGNGVWLNGTWGLEANRSGGLTVSDNSVMRNGTAGQFGGGASVRESFATIERNAFDRNVGNGLQLDEFLETRSLWPINDNTAHRNTAFGIFAVQPGFTGVGNVAQRNGEPAQCFNFPCNLPRPR